MIRIKKCDIYNSILMAIWFFAEYRYFNIPQDIQFSLVKYNTMSVHYVKIVVLLFVIALNIRRFHVENNYHRREMEILVGSFVISAIVSVINYGYAIKTAERFVNILYLPILYFALLILLQTPRDVKRFVLMLTIFNLLSVSIYTIQAVIYNSSETLFLTFRWEQNTISKRNGYIRIIECLNMTLLSYIVSAALIYKSVSKKQILHIVNMVLSTYYLIFVSMTRIIAIIAGIIISITFILKYKPRKKSMMAIKWMVIVASIVLLLMIGFKEIVEYFSLIKTENSYISRIGAFKYYGNLIRNFVISGILFADFTGSDYYTLAHGAMGRYFTADIGAFGIIINYGMITFVVYMWIVYRFIKKNRYNNVFDFVFLLYMVLTLPTQSQIDLQRLGVFGIILALSDNSEGLLEVI